MWTAAGGSHLGSRPGIDPLLRTTLQQGLQRGLQPHNMRRPLSAESSGDDLMPNALDLSKQELQLQWHSTAGAHPQDGRQLRLQPLLRGLHAVPQHQGAPHHPQHHLVRPHLHPQEASGCACDPARTLG